MGRTSKKQTNMQKDILKISTGGKQEKTSSKLGKKTKEMLQTIPEKEGPEDKNIQVNNATIIEETKVQPKEKTVHKEHNVQHEQTTKTVDKNALPEDTTKDNKIEEETTDSDTIKNILITKKQTITEEEDN